MLDMRGRVERVNQRREKREHVQRPKSEGSQVILHCLNRMAVMTPGMW